MFQCDHCKGVAAGDEGLLWGHMELCDLCNEEVSKGVSNEIDYFPCFVAPEKDRLYVEEAFYCKINTPIMGFKIVSEDCPRYIPSVWLTVDQVRTLHFMLGNFLGE